MDQLSDELLCLIFSYIDPWRLCHNVQYVCKRFRRIALENQLWYGRSLPYLKFADVKQFYERWTQIDWHNEWKWRNAPLKIVAVDDTVTPLTFTLHNGDIVALLDDGSLRRWKRPSQSESQWREVSSISSTTGMETFRVRFRTGISTQTNYASTQLSYNDAIAVSKTHLYFGAGRLLKQVDVEHEFASSLFHFRDQNTVDQRLITTVHRLGPSSLLFGSSPSEIHLFDLRQRFTVSSQGIPKVPLAGQATPLCIRAQSVDDVKFFVSGRFPAVLLYDLRMGLRSFHAAYSGADCLSSMTFVSSDRLVLGGAYRGRGTLECVDTKSFTVTMKNRWTASNATILGVAARNTGVVAAGGAGVIRFFDGIQRCTREINLDRMITKVEVEKQWDSEYEKAVDRIFLNCGADGICYLEPGRDPESFRTVTREHATQTSSLRAIYSDRHFLRNWMTRHDFR